MKTYDDLANIVQETEGLLAKPVETRFLFETAAQLPSGQNIIEIGSYRGLSSLCLAFGAQNSNNHLFCFTMWQGDHSVVWHTVMAKHYLRPTVTYGNANTVLQQITIPQVGLVFIDSSHLYEDCKTQFELTTREAVPGCLVAFHDYDHPNYPGVKQYCDELVAAGRLMNPQKVGCIFYGTTDTSR